MMTSVPTFSPAGRTTSSGWGLAAGILTTPPGAIGLGMKCRPAAGRIAGLFVLLSLAAISGAAATSFDARGNEPFWHIGISDAGITFQALDGERFTIAPVPEAEVSDGVETYLAEVEGQPFSLTIADELCVDTMSGMPHPKTVAVAWGERDFSGCGGDPASLLHGEWLIEEIAGEALVEQSQPSVAFDPDGGVNGNGSCNRLVGSYALTGEGLSVSGLAATRMACEQSLMDQEHVFVQILEAVSRFEMDPEGRLVLHSGDGQTLLARRE